VLPVLNDNVTEDTTNVTEDVTVKGNDVTEDAKDVTEDVTVSVTEAGRRRIKILQLLKASSKLTVDEISNTLSVSRRTVLRDLDVLRVQGKIVRDGGDKFGTWIVKEE
jgi:predicted HTH transcriptional regulator